MAITVADHKTICEPFGNGESIVRVTYDFAEDAGTAGAFNLVTADGDIVITDAHMYVETAFDSAGDAAVIDLGVVGVDTDSLIDNAPQGRFAAGKFINCLTALEGNVNGTLYSLPFLLADTKIIAMTVGTAALTAGKAHFFFRYHKLDK
jgi:hypothetical protein